MGPKPQYLVRFDRATLRDIKKPSLLGHREKQYIVCRKLFESTYGIEFTMKEERTARKGAQ